MSDSPALPRKSGGCPESRLDGKAKCRNMLSAYKLCQLQFGNWNIFSCFCARPVMSDSPHPDDERVTYSLPVRSIIDQQIDRDHSLLETLTLRCGECQRHGAAKDGIWHLVSGVVYCSRCFEAEAHT